MSINDDVQELLISEMKRLGKTFPLAFPAVTRSSTLRHAQQRIQEAPPTLVLLDPDTPRGEGRQAPRDVDELLERTPVPVLITLTQSDERWARTVIRHSNRSVWDWDNTDCHLEDLLRLLLSPPEHRHFRALVRLRRPQPVCDIDLESVKLFRGLRLNVGAQYRRIWRNEDLQSLADMVDRQAAWNGLADKGFALFRDTLDDLGSALLEAGARGDTLDLRFEIDTDSVDGLFSMPIELLNRDSDWQTFFCRVAPMARCVPPRTPRTSTSPRPKLHILYVDAGAARGSMDVVGQNGALERVPFPDLSDAVAAEWRALKPLGDDLCKLEPLTPADEAISLKERLQQRLRDAGDVPDIVHFTGHAIGPSSGATELVFPSLVKGSLDRLSIEEFASWLPAGVRLVVLSACQGISVNTAMKLHSEKGIAVLGFRWRVEAEAAADFISNFYIGHVRDHLPLATAYKTACFKGNASQLAWAAAVLLDHD